MNMQKAFIRYLILPLVYSICGRHPVVQFHYTYLRFTLFLVFPSADVVLSDGSW